jgi:signal transduction histidine kinase
MKSLTRWSAILTTVLVMICSAAGTCRAQVPTAPPAAALAPPAIFTEAEYVISKSMRPPPDTDAWKPIALPDNWNISHPGFEGQIWYRIRLGAVNSRITNVLHLPRNSATSIEAQVNGERIAISNVYGDPHITELQRPIIFTVPGLMVRADDNILYFRLRGNADLRHGLTRVYFGSGPVLRTHYYEKRFDLQVTSIAMFGAIMLAAGLLSLFLWRTERQQRVLLWFAITSLAGFLAACLLLWPPSTQQQHTRQFILFVSQYLYFIPLVVLTRRMIGRKGGRVETVLWTVFITACIAAAALDARTYPWLVVAATVSSVVLVVACLTWILMRGRPRLPEFMIGIALVVSVLFKAHDSARWFGIADFDNLFLSPFAMPFIVLALGVAILDRHIAVTRELETANTDLEKRVNDKVGEIESTYQKMQNMVREQVVLKERQRIMADMHDGLGSRIISLMSRMRSRDMDFQRIEQRLEEILMDLRAIVDSLEPVDGDLGVVLGNIRYRMSRAIEDSGVEFSWKVEPMPPIEGLTPDMVLSIQRIVLEALTNALRHAKAGSVTVSGHRENGEVIIEVCDNGVGYVTGQPSAGHGLRNMRARSDRLNAIMEVDSKPGQGTRILLRIPVDGLPAAAMETRAGV